MYTVAEPVALPLQSVSIVITESIIGPAISFTITLVRIKEQFMASVMVTMYDPANRPVAV